MVNEIYNVDWYNSDDPKVRKFVLFWLMKAQDPLRMSGGGLLNVDRTVFLQVGSLTFDSFLLFDQALSGAESRIFIFCTAPTMKYQPKNLKFEGWRRQSQMHSS